MRLNQSRGVQDRRGKIRMPEPARRRVVNGLRSECEYGTIMDTMTLTVKKIPSALHKSLKLAAGADGRSLNSLLLSVLAAAMDERERLSRMRATRGELETFVRSLPPSDDAAELIRQSRDTR